MPSYENMLSAGVHYGRKKTVKHPKMEPFIYALKDSIHLINLYKTEEELKAAAEFLKKDKRVSGVRYPWLTDDPTYGVAKKYLKNGFGGMVVFGIKGGYDAGVKFINNITLFSHLANVGDAKSLVLHPSSTSHSQLSEQQQRESGLTPDLIRLSIGLEHPDDIIEALDEGLAISQK